MRSVEDVPEGELATWKKAAVGIKGLTVDAGDSPIIHLLQDKKTMAAFLHESLHAYSHDSFKVFFGKDLDEGVTESLAREVMA